MPGNVAGSALVIFLKWLQTNGEKATRDHTARITSEIVHESHARRQAEAQLRADRAKQALHRVHARVVEGIEQGNVFIIDSNIWMDPGYEKTLVVLSDALSARGVVLKMAGEQLAEIQHLRKKKGEEASSSRRDAIHAVHLIERLTTLRTLSVQPIVEVDASKDVDSYFLRKLVERMNKPGEVEGADCVMVTNDRATHTHSFRCDR